MEKNKENYSVLQDVRAWLGRISFTFRGSALSKNDSHQMRAALSFLHSLGCDLLPASQLRHYHSWLAATKVIDVFELGRFLGDVDSCIKNYSSRCENESHLQRWDYPSFKRSASAVKGYWGIISPISPLIEKFLLDPDVPEFRIIIQWLNFIRRLNLYDLDLSDDMQHDYVLFEQSVQTWTYDEELLDDINDIIFEWFGRFHDLESFVPRHGPGSIAGMKGKPSITKKYYNMYSDQRLLYLSKYIGDVQSFCPVPLGEGLDRTSDLVCVPKSMITNRTISKEPVSLQYFQQGVMAQIMDFVHDHPIMRRHISFVDQSVSAELAREGSILGEYATIDLSNASDSVSLYMVKRAFRNTWVYPLLMCSRSDNTRLFDGTPLRLNKFAPMGSAVCFPVETIIFSACCELARRKVGKHLHYRVFGDDIVIHEDLVECLGGILASCHFKVNDTKSFWGTHFLNFREACGGEYFNGEEVTPLRISRGFRNASRFTTQSADRISAYISFANQAFDKGFLHLRREILQHLKDHMAPALWSQLVYSTTGSRGIKTFEDCCTNYRLESRINTFLQYKEVNGIVPKSIKLDKGCDECSGRAANAAQCEHIRYFEWLRSTYNRRTRPREGDGVVSICPVRAVMRGSWVATALL